MQREPGAGASVDELPPSRRAPQRRLRRRPAHLPRPRGAGKPWSSGPALGITFRVIRLCTVLPVLILTLVLGRQAWAQETCTGTVLLECDDGDPCTIGDRCNDGTCAGVPLDCNDGASCTDDFCDGGTCVHNPVDDRCATGNECVQTQCLPGPRADAQGCVGDSASLELTACSEDQNPCTVDRCRAGACAHDAVDDPSGCSPVVPSYHHAIDLRAGVDRLLAYMNDEAQVGGDTGSRLDDDLGAVAADLDGVASVLAGRTPDSGQPQGLVRPIGGVRLAVDTIAQERGRVALLYARAAPAHVLDFLGRLSSGRRHGDVTPDAARELRRNGRILLTGTKALKRDVKNLQRTFSVFQR